MNYIKTIAITLLSILSITLSQNYSLSFESIDEYVSINGYDLTGDISDISVSVDAALKSGTEGNLWNQVDGGELTLRFDELDGEPMIRVGGKFGSWQNIYIDNNLDTEFHNFILVYSRLNQYISLYIDYVLIQTLDLNTSNLSSVDAYDDNFGWNSNGQLLIDNVNIWHGTAFSESQIQDNESNLSDLINPSGSWNMNEGSGDIIYDQIGDNNGTIIGARWEEVISGCNDPLAENFNSDSNLNDGSCTYPDNGDYSLNFDGADDYVNLGTSSSLEINGEISLCAWVKFDDFEDGTSTVISKITDGELIGYALEKKSSQNKLSFWIGDGNSFHLPS